MDLKKATFEDRFFLIQIISFVQEALAAIHCQQAKVCG